MTIKLRRVLYLTKFVGNTDNLYGYFVCVKVNDFEAIFTLSRSLTALTAKITIT